MRKLDFIIYDNCNILLKFIQIFPAKILQSAEQNGCSGRWFVFPMHIAVGGG